MLRALERAIAHGARVRHRHGRRTPQPPHRLPRRLPDARHRTRFRAVADPARTRIPRASRRFGGTKAVFTPDPHRDRLPDAGRTGARRHLRIAHHQRPDDRLHAQGARAAARRGCSTGRAIPPTIPACFSSEPKGTILPLGGLDAGHKGYGLALIVEAMTGGLAGLGRADPTEGWGATVCVQVLDPEAFGGLVPCPAGRLVSAGVPFELRRGPASMRCGCRVRRVARRREQLERGVELQEDIAPGLAPWAEKLGVRWPAALETAEAEPRPAEPR